MRERLRHLAAGIVGDDTAEDVVHDAFCRLWKANPRVNDEIEASRLSYRVVHNAAIDMWRRKSKVNVTEIEEVTDDTEEETTEEVYDAVLAIARRSLSERQFEIFEAHDIAGLGYDEIAAEHITFVASK